MKTSWAMSSARAWSLTAPWTKALIRSRYREKSSSKAASSPARTAATRLCSVDDGADRFSRSASPIQSSPLRCVYPGATTFEPNRLIEDPSSAFFMRFSTFVRSSCLRPSAWRAILRSCSNRHKEDRPMAIHLTPTELARESGLDRRDVIVKCVELGVPIFNGRIDKTLFLSSLRELPGSPAQQPQAAPA